MKQLVLGLVVGLVWIVLTAAVAWAVPPRGGDTQPDLAVDERWLQRTPYNPVHYDRVPRGTSATTTTTSASRVPLASGPQVPSARSLRPPPVEPTARSSGGVEQWRGLVASYGGWDVDLMLRIMGCESGGRSSAYNRSGATGLFQILGGPFDPVANVSVAHSMWTTRGTQPWNASRSCWS